jgi:hypothetical protein
MQTQLETITRSLADKLDLDVSAGEGIDDTVRMFKELRARTPEGKRVMFYRKEIIDYVSVENERDEDQKVVAALSDLPADVRDARAREIFEQGPFFEMLTYFGAADVSVTRYVDRNGAAETAFDVTVDVERLRDYITFLEDMKSPYSGPVRDELLRIDAGREPPAANIRRVRLIATMVVPDPEDAGRFVLENSKFH